MPAYGGGYGSNVDPYSYGGSAGSGGLYVSQDQWATMTYSINANTTSAGYYINPPEPARPYTSLDWLKDEVERVCAEARKVRL